MVLAPTAKGSLVGAMSYAETRLAALPSALAGPARLTPGRA